MRHPRISVTAAWTLGVLLLGALTFSPPSSAQAPSSGRRGVLFVGNSYTYFNNLPAVLQGLAASARVGELDVRMVAPGGWRLKDHWEKGEARAALTARRWDYVVLQDQSTLGVNHFVEGVSHVSTDELFRPFAERWVAEARRVGARPIFYLTWASRATPEDQAALDYAYINAAKTTGAMVAPVGLAWQAVREHHAGIDLFQKDGSHPSPAGTYLAACTLFAAIFDRDPTGLPGEISGSAINLETEKAEADKTVTLVKLPDDQARTLQRAAWDAWLRVKKAGGYPSVAPVAPPMVSPLPTGEPLSEAALAGAWKGTLRLYPVGPVEMLLHLQRRDGGWHGRLEITYGSKDFQDESVELADFRVGERDFTFSDPRSVGVNNLRVDFRGILTRSAQLRGTASAIRETPELPPVRVYGSWELQKAP